MDEKLVIALALAGGAALWWRARQEAAARAAAAAAAAAGSGVGAGMGLVCGVAAAAGGPAAGIACAGAGVVADVLHTSQAEIDAKNAALNGGIVARDAFDAPLFWASSAHYYYSRVQPTASGRAGMVMGKRYFRWPNIPRHANGCVPARGADEKCASGTVRYTDTDDVSGDGAQRVGVGRWFSSQASTDARDYQGAEVPDPLTRPHDFASPFIPDYPRREQLLEFQREKAREGKLQFGGFPLECSAGEVAWWGRGRPICCPKGTSVVAGLDGPPSCQAPRPRPTVVGANGQGGVVSYDVAADGTRTESVVSAPPRPTPTLQQSIGTLLGARAPIAPTSAPSPTTIPTLQSSIDMLLGARSGKLSASGIMPRAVGGKMSAL